MMEWFIKFCVKEGLSREVLFEVLFEYYIEDKEVWIVILEQVKQKVEFCQAIVNYKWVKMMMEKFGQKN